MTNGPLTRRLRAQPRLRISIRDSVSRADVAEFVLTELEHGDHLLSAPDRSHNLTANPQRRRSPASTLSAAESVRR